MDPGRTPPRRRSDGSQTAGRGLPPALAARFDLVKELQRGAQADVYVVGEKSGDRKLVLKVYDGGWSPNQELWAHLRSGRTSRAVVETLETGRADGRCYEIMEYLTGDDLMTLRRRGTLEELGTDQLEAIIGQLVEALDELHAAGFVHRDLKPSNILVRKLSPIEVAIVDFGISSRAGEAVDDRNGTAPYTPPRFLAAGSVEPANDMWALGVSLIEFFMGAWLFDGLNDQVALRSRIVDGPISTEAVADARLRMLCTGLTVPAERPRWTTKQVRAWLAGDSPPLPGYDATPATGRAGAAEEPYRYRGTDFWFPDELASAMTLNWEDAALTLFEDDQEPLKRLRGWVRRFPDISLPSDASRRTRKRTPIDVQLLRVLRALDPTHPPMYRGHNIAGERLPEIARSAYGGVGNHPDVVSELSVYGLLPLLAGGREANGLASGDGLRKVADDWKAECDRLRRGRADLPEEGRADLEEFERERPVTTLAIGLLAVTAPVDTVAVVRRTVERCARRASESDGDLAWFVRLAGRPDQLWLAYLLVPAIEARIDRIVEEAEAARAQRDWMLRTQAIREWSRRQNRPQALAWGMAGVAALGTVWTLLIGLSDVVDVSSDATIVAAWLVTVLSLSVVLACEALLAWEIGGSFHPRYSLLGAALITVGRAARAVLARGAALPVVLCTVGGLIAAAVLVPVPLALAPAVLTPPWAWRRYVGWEGDRVREQRDLERAERERQQEPAAAREGTG